VFEPLQQITSFNTNADKNTNATLSVFANPDNIQLTINSLNTGSALVYIIDINGRLLFEKEIIITNEITMLNFPSVRTGVYVAVLKSKQSNLREKFISR
jgi:Secretion system C-terminal sorting domain